jgi:hypothetical protein
MVCPPATSEAGNSEATFTTNFDGNFTTADALGNTVTDCRNDTLNAYKMSLL